MKSKTRYLIVKCHIAINAFLYFYVVLTLVYLKKLLFLILVRLCMQRFNISLLFLSLPVTEFFTINFLVAFKRIKNVKINILRNFTTFRLLLYGILFETVNKSREDVVLSLLAPFYSLIRSVEIKVHDKIFIIFPRQKETLLTSVRCKILEFATLHFILLHFITFFFNVC